MREYYWILAGDASGALNLEIKPVEGEVVTLQGYRYLIDDVDIEGNDEFYVVLRKLLTNH